MKSFTGRGPAGNTSFGGRGILKAAMGVIGSGVLAANLESVRTNTIQAVDNARRLFGQEEEQPMYLPMPVPQEQRRQTYSSGNHSQSLSPEDSRNT
mmetsp:Transcript_21174/g.42980  ORF Transcript_21174/g.42980 Transcript_21174/m.42980 type:complete len:96 (+) Transcript_21174:74-361(+)